MNTLAKLIAATAALVASLAFAWIAKDRVTVRHEGDIVGVEVPNKVEIELRGSYSPVRFEHMYKQMY
jgi:hypothetical protein